METLASIFPTHDAGFLASTLAMHDNDLESTVDALLEGNGISDAALAHSLLQELATQWESDTKRKIPDEVRTQPARLEMFLRDASCDSTMPSLATRVVASARSFVARLTAPRSTPVPVFRHHLTEPMLSPLDTDRSA